jgi:hypothetical protein
MIILSKDNLRRIMWRLDQWFTMIFSSLMHWVLTLFSVVISFQTILMVLYAQNEKMYCCLRFFYMIIKKKLNDILLFCEIIYFRWLHNLCKVLSSQNEGLCPLFYKHPIKMHNVLTNMMAIVMCSNCKQMWWTFPFILYI